MRWGVSDAGFLLPSTPLPLAAQPPPIVGGHHVVLDAGRFDYQSLPRFVYRAAIAQVNVTRW